MIVIIKNKAGVIQTEINNISNVEINQVLNDASISTFTISIENNQAIFNNFKESNRFEFWDGQTMVQDGFFAALDSGLTTITVSVSDVELFRKKIILDDKQYAIGTQISTILQEILDEINTREDTGFTLNAPSSQTIEEQKDYSSGTNYFEILQDLSKSGFEFNISQGVISFLTTIGTDRTQQNEDFFQFYYNQKSPEGNNVQNIQTLIPSRIFNAITAKDFNGNTVTVTDAASIVEFGRLEKVISVDGDLTKVANEELAKTKDSTKDITIEPVLENFFDVGLGDLCNAEIISLNNLNNFNGNVKVLEKNLIDSEKQTFSIKISSTGVRILDFFQQFAAVQRNVNKLLIQ